jgi:hypothetical protein
VLPAGALVIDQERRIQKRLNTIPSIESKLGVFVGLSGAIATVNIGPNTVDIPYVGQYPAQVGETVQLERRNGQIVATGPANPRSAAGRVTAVTTPKLTVDVDGQLEMLPYDPDAYSAPAINDEVSIDWFYPGGRVSGRLSITPVIVPPPTAAPVSAGPGRQTFTAQSSGSFNPAPVRSDDVIYGGSYPAGGWFYGPKIADTIPNGATITVFRIYLVCRLGSGSQLRLGTHTQGSKPGTAFPVSSLATINGINAGFTGWVDLLALGINWADFLKSNLGGIGTTGAGYRILRGVSSDALSGALDIGWS